MGQKIEWCCKLYHVGVVEKESEQRTRAVLRWYQFGAPCERMAVDIAGAQPSMPCGNRHLPAATGLLPGEELPQTLPDVVAALKQCWYKPRAGGMCRGALVDRVCLVQSPRETRPRPEVAEQMGEPVYCP